MILSTPKTCRWCRQEFDIAKRRRSAKFCSFKCKELDRAERKRKGAPRLRIYPPKSNSKRQVKCAVCGASFIRKRIGMTFCSRRCWIKDCQGRIVPKLCLNCGTKFMPRDLYDQKNKKYCGNECRIAYMRGVNSPVYRDGRDGFRGSDWNLQSAKARERDGECKSLCHDPTLAKTKEKLSVDHIVAYGIVIKFCPDKSPNDLVNLLSLCRKCHAIKTHGPEARLYRGDIVGFIQGMGTIAEREIVMAALGHYGLA